VFSNTVYVRVGRNQFRVKHIESGADTTVVASTPFTTTRLLIGQFVAAELALKGAFKQLATGRLFAVSPSVVIHAMEMVEGGLSEIEERTLREVAIGAGAGKAVVWVGRELSDSEVKEKLSAK
jgi:hypothetical protein